jgi:hypothetical protein
VNQANRFISEISAPILIDNGLQLDFLQYIFPKDEKTGRYKVTSTNLVGEAATYLAQPVLEPAELAPEEGKTLCILELPAMEGLSDCRNKWVAYSKNSMIRINHLLKVYFEMDFYRYYLKGLQYGYEKQEIVEMYVISRNLTTGEPFDTLHKRVYRHEQKLMAAKVRQLRRKAKYFFDEQDNTLKAK